MKDQYFGDVNDYRKYGLLRAIVATTGTRLGVCWMLTAPDGRSDGRHLSYLDNPARYRHFDPVLFDWLKHTMEQHRERRTARIEITDLLAGAAYFSKVLGDGHENRKDWFAHCRRQLIECDLVFFDPDNGLERSVKFGNHQSHKFLYWAEVREIFSVGASVLVYQHFPREPRATFVARLAARLLTETSAAAIFSFITPHVLFLLAAQARHAESFRGVIRKISVCWPEKQITGSEVSPYSSAARHAITSR